jgi:hypothetical protein
MLSMLGQINLQYDINKVKLLLLYIKRIKISSYFTGEVKHPN